MREEREKIQQSGVFEMKQKKIVGLRWKRFLSLHAYLCCTRINAIHTQSMVLFFFISRIHFSLLLYFSSVSLSLFLLACYTATSYSCHKSCDSFLISNPTYAAMCVPI